MDPQVLTLIALAVVFVGAVLPGVALDLVSVLALAFLVIGGVLTTDAAASGFGSPTLLAVACMFVLAEGLQQTGAVQGLHRLAQRMSRHGLRRLFLVVLPIVMVLSGLMNNTGVVVLLLPVFLAASSKEGVAPSRVLLPLSYAAILGGTLTVVGTTTNLLVDGIVRREGLPGLELLDFLPIGAVFCVIGFAYLVLFAPRLLPDRSSGLATLESERQHSEYLTEVLLGSRSRVVGRTLREFPAIAGAVRFLMLVRGEETIWPPFDEVVLKQGDLLVVKGKPQELVELMRKQGLEGPPDEEGGRVLDVNLDLAEVIIAPGSRLDGATVRQARLRERFDVVVLGVLRHGVHLREHLGDLSLRVGDILLVQGEEPNLHALGGAREDVLLLGGEMPRPPRKARRILTAAVGLTALLLAATNIVSLPVAALLGAVVIVASGAISSGQAYRSINLRLLVILGCMLGVGQAVATTGLADEIAGFLVAKGQPLGPYGILGAIFLATVVLTELVTNAGTAGIMVPVAIATAHAASLSYRPFVMAVALAASCSFLTPIGYQTNLLVYGPGGYKFYDYARFGLPLTLLVFVAGVLLLPVFFPF